GRRVARDAENARVLREGLEQLGLAILVAPEARSNILTTFRLPPGVAYDALHDALKRRGYVIYAGQGDLRTYAFRVANMGTLTPRDMSRAVQAFADAFAGGSLALVLAAAVLHAGWNALAKRGRDPLAFLALCSCVAAPVLLPLAAPLLWRDGVPARAVPFVFATIALHVLYFYSLGRA